ncbi:hypothetical protein LTR35_017479 [Friedmanniomyces endolithicus]|nr:hypothetical protein LTR35_017479 [Friedmanniomyces endolithicus]
MVLHDELAKINEFISPVKRYMQRMTKAFEVTQSELITARKQLSESQSLLQTRKARKRGKRVALKIASFGTPTSPSLSSRMFASMIPKALEKGNTIAFVSPSVRANDLFPAATARGKAYVESLGFNVRVIYRPLPASCTIAESIRTRCEELHEAFREPSITAVLYTIGGNGANELLRFLDYDLIKRNPKIFVGYSDTTFLHYALFANAGLRTFYGPSVITDFSDIKPMQFTTDHFMHVLTTGEGLIGRLPRSPEYAIEHSDFILGNEASTTSRELRPAPSWRWVRKGTVVGKLYGGTMRCVVELQGSPYKPSSWKDKILFLETSTGGRITEPYSVREFRNHFVDLALSGVLGDIQGLVMGRGYKYDKKMQDEIASVIQEVIEVVAGRKDSCPVLMNVDFGHTSPFLTLPYGALTKLDSEADEFAVLDRGVRSLSR